MTINKNITLPNPEKHYGAIYGGAPNSKILWYASFYASATIALFVYTTALITLPERVHSTILTIMIIALIGISILGGKTFGTNRNQFKLDLHNNRIKYAHTVFKTWVEQKYNIEITEEQALKLMNGNTISIFKNDKKIPVNFKRTPESEKLFTTGNMKYEYPKNIKEKWDYNTENIDLQLVINTNPPSWTKTIMK